MSSLLTLGQVSERKSIIIVMLNDFLFVLSKFEKVFPQVVVSNAHPNHATLQSFVVAIYVSSRIYNMRALLVN